MKITDIDVFRAKTLFALYREHGLGYFANWLTMKHQNIDRGDVVQALQFPEVRESGEKLLVYYKLKVDELESMLKE